MTPRIEKLRKESKESVPTISHERAVLLSRFYESGVSQTVSVPVTRALAFKYLLENKSICICDGELILGERGPAPKATPTYPEVCLHTLNDLTVFHSRSKVPYKVDDETRDVYEKSVIPFWAGKSMREKIMAHMTPEWIDAYNAGIFTEFQEQRSPGHTCLGGKIYQKGFRDLKQEIQDAICSLDFMEDTEALDKLEELKAMEIAADALIGYANRHAAILDGMAKEETDRKRKDELFKMAAICRRVPEHAPETFWEALQYYWFVHIGVITELNPWDAFNPGRLDQHLYPFYKKELEQGTLDEETARELLCAFWIKFNNHPAPPKTGITSEESNTYVDFALINLGGVNKDNQDAVNPLSYIILDIIEEMRLLQPSSMVQISKKSPDRFLKRALKIVKTGFGQPSIFNTDAIVQELTRQGKSVSDAREGGASGCVEAGAFGRECYILTGYFNIPKMLELALHNGVDPRTGNTIGIKTGDPLSFKTFDDLMAAFEKQLRFFIDVKIRGNNVIERLNAKYMPVPFLSLLIDDCITKGKDYNAGGARYNTSYIQGVGLGSITDSLAALKMMVYDWKELSLSEFIRILDDDFNGHDGFLRRLLDEAPKYGNDDDRADDVMRRVFSVYYSAVSDRPNTRGGVHRINLLPTTSHVYFGSVIGALPDGRKAQKPLSEGISPVQGADRNGPTAVVKSASKIDHILTGGTLLNQKFLPQVLKNDEGIQKLLHLVRSYFKLDGHHIQFNVVSADTLKKAKKSPDDYRDLIVRVAGYSDYFVDLTEDLQDEIINRTAHEEL